MLLEHIHFNSKGNPRHMEVHGYPIFDEVGEFSQIIERMFLFSSLYVLNAGGVNPKEINNSYSNQLSNGFEVL